MAAIRAKRGWVPISPSGMVMWHMASNRKDQCVTNWNKWRTKCLVNGGEHPKPARVVRCTLEADR